MFFFFKSLSPYSFSLYIMMTTLTQPSPTDAQQIERKTTKHLHTAMYNIKIVTLLCRSNINIRRPFRSTSSVKVSGSSELLTTKARKEGLWCCMTSKKNTDSVSITRAHHRQGDRLGGASVPTSQTHPRSQSSAVTYISPTMTFVLR